MKKTILLLTLFCCGGAWAPLGAQDATALQVELAQAREPKTLEQTLTELKAANAALLEKQKATLQRLEQLEKQADQLRIFAKRS